MLSFYNKFEKLCEFRHFLDEKTSWQHAGRPR